MHLQPPVSQPATTVSDRLSIISRPLLLSQGQQIVALVQSIGPQGIKLLINGQVLAARSEVSLEVGQKLQLLVGQEKNRLILQIRQPIETRQADLRQGIVRQAGPVSQPILRAILPNQQPLMTLFRQLAETPLQKNLPLFIEKLASLLTPLPVALLGTNQLRQQVQNSGLFLENRLKDLAKNHQPVSGKSTDMAPPVSADRKSALLKISQLIQQLLVAPEGENLQQPLKALTRDVDSSLDRIRLHQLNALADSNGLQKLSIEQVVNHHNHLLTLNMTVERKTEQEPATEGQDSEATPSLCLDLETLHLGPIKILIKQSMAGLTIAFQSEEKSAQNRLKDGLPNLQRDLESADLKVRDLQVGPGRGLDSLLNIPGDIPLVDTQA